MFYGIMGILFNYLTTSRPDLLPMIASMTFISCSIRVGKLKGAWLRARLAKTSSNLCLTSSEIAHIEALTAIASAAKLEVKVKGIVIIEAFIVEAGTLVSTGVKTLFLLKWATTPAITSKVIKSTWPSSRGVRLPPTSILIEILVPAIIFSRTKSLGIESLSMMMLSFISSLVLPSIKSRGEVM